MRFVALAGLAALAACGGDTANMKSDWERQNEGRLLKDDAQFQPLADLPQYPKNENLVEFFVSSASTFRFYIDRASLGVKNRLVHYTLVARSASGADNVTYEAINCASAEYRILAGGQAGAWISRPTEWREISPRSVQRWHSVLRRDYFCPNNVAISDAAEGVRALELKGHPWSRSNEPSFGGGSGR
jgi:hypothetical protein